MQRYATSCKPFGFNIISCVRLILFKIKNNVYAGRAQNSVRVWSIGHATCSGAKDALSAEERLGPHGLLHIIQG